MGMKPLSRRQCCWPESCRQIAHQTPSRSCAQATFAQHWPVQAPSSPPRLQGSGQAPEADAMPQPVP
eukprot:1198388-Rhodomonas_salina.1